MTDTNHPGGLPCEKIVALTTDYLEGSLSAELSHKFELHIANCAPCREYLAQMRDTVTMLGGLTRRPSDDVLAAFRKALAEWTE